jgi:hypothetical protein
VNTGAGAARLFQPALVRHQHRIAHARLAPQAGQHVRRIGHLRHPFRADEAGRLDHRQARRGQPLDQFDLDRRGDARGFVLQTIARPNLDDADFIVHPGHDGAIPGPDSSNKRPYSPEAK